MFEELTQHPRKKEFAAAVGLSWWSVNRACRAGAAKTVKFPDGERIDATWAKEKIENGFTAEELALITRR